MVLQPFFAVTERKALQYEMDLQRKSQYEQGKNPHHILLQLIILKHNI